ncbi:MAG: DNA gyrase subunit A [Candidatus Moranbacteria bacterium]|nr:DNA gyrase subunit A [Candidatus Moranbacteria bacterium]
MEVGFVKNRRIVEEMKNSYLDYAMTIIVSRALPDVRDGLKPSQRRILYAMHQRGLTHNARYKKCAAVVGDVLGKYHPHGDQALYETLARLAQDFSLRYLLIDGQGNFGSVDGDNAAQMRYTECRMTAVSEELLADIGKETVDFVDNYDASLKEPGVLPAALPNILLNGTMGIAVGMATNIPPHNLGEVVDAAIHLIDNPDCSLEEIMNFIQGPDFPTGGMIYSKNDILKAYSTGRGGIVTRAKCRIEEVKGGLNNIIVTEITYQSNKANTISKIASLVKDGKIKGIKNIRDESDKDGIRVVIELKKDAFPKKVLNQLYQLTDLQKNFNLNMLALEDGIQPKVMNIKEIITQFVAHRRVVVTRRSEYELKKAKARVHILEGLKKAIDIIDQVISTIRGSKTKEIAHKNLMDKFEFSDKQATAILEMRLQTLAGLERQKILDELKEKLDLIKYLEKILGSEEELKKVIKDELKERRDKYQDERRTKVIKNGIGEFTHKDLVPNEDAIVLISKSGYIKRMNPSNYRVQKRGGVGVMGVSTKEDDVVTHIFSVSTHDDIYFFTDSGKVYVIKAYELPEGSRLSKGQAIVNFLNLPQREKITAVLPVGGSDTLDSIQKEPKYLFMATKLGIVKKVKLNDFKNVRNSGIVAIKLKPEDQLWWVKPTYGEDEIMLVTEQGQSIRFREKDIRVMGRVARGVRGIRLKADDRVMGVDIIRGGDIKDKKLLVITEKGYGKKTYLRHYKIQKRGGSGIKTLKVAKKNGTITHASIIENEDEKEDIIAISQHGNVIRTKISEISVLGRSTQGVKIMRLRADDRLAQATKL